jgi:hypothetical protein
LSDGPGELRRGLDQQDAGHERLARKVAAQKGFSARDLAKLRTRIRPTTIRRISFSMRSIG